MHAVLVFIITPYNSNKIPTFSPKDSTTALHFLLLLASPHHNNPHFQWVTPSQPHPPTALGQIIKHVVWAYLQNREQAQPVST